jgi:ABC-type antimicrobial peptide transport system permease subunit
MAMSQLLVHDLVRSKSKLFRMFLSNLVLTTLNVVLINLLNFLTTIEDAFARNLDTVYFNYTIIAGIFTFMIFIIVIVFLIDIISNVVFIMYYIEKRTKDIGIMKAAGANQTYILQFFFFAPAIACLSSFFIASLICGIVMASVWPALFPNTPLSNVFFLILMLGNVAAVILTPAYKVGKLFEKKVSENLNLDHNRDYFDLRKTSRFRNFLKRLGKTVLLSYKNLLTRKNEFARSVLILTCACLASGLLFTSAFVIQATYSNDLKASLGGDASSRVVVAGNEAMVDFITGNYRSFYEPDINPDYQPIMYSNGFNMNRSAFNASRFADSISGMDWRVVYETTAREVQGIETTPPSGYRTWGKSRSCPVVIQGIEWNASFNGWGGFSQSSFDEKGGSIILGDSVAGLIIENMEFQKIDLGGIPNKIAGQVFDPFNNGFTVYMDPQALRAMLNKTAPFHNCVFFTLKPGPVNELAASLAELDAYMNLTYGANFTARSLEPAFSSIMDSTRSIWWLYTGIASLIFIFSIFFQQEFINMTIQSNSRDYKIMHALGMGRRRIARIIHEEFTIVLSIACTSAFCLSLIISSLFLIPMPSLPPIIIPIAIFGAIWLCFYVLCMIIVTWGKRLRFLS